MTARYKREAWIARLSLFTTLVLFGFVAEFIVREYIAAFEQHSKILLWELSLFTLAVIVIVYGNLLYHICLIGHYIRKILHIPAGRDALESLYDRDAPALTVLIPSYKEERRVIWQTMVSAALAEYPAKEVVLLVDDAPNPKALEDQQLLNMARFIPVELQAIFDKQAEYYRDEQVKFAARRHSGEFDPVEEFHAIACHYESAAAWLRQLADDFRGDLAFESLPYDEKFFVDAILLEPARKHEARAHSLRAQLESGHVPAELMVARHYARLAGLCAVRFSSFERKKYVNLSHDANKAMNLNSYMALIGKSWREVETEAGLELHECVAKDAAFSIPDADYIDTIDADSLMLSDYLIRLIYMMEQPKNARIAVAQSPCSSFPGCPTPLQRIAGACIDVQFHTHQGYTHWDASFWVGANAMLRRAALEEIKEVHVMDGKRVTIYIQDRTVIEDTESTIDLVGKGWKLYNYPERLTFSATPPDFGSLLIQRRRWANGGLIILPKLLQYVWRQKKNRRLAKELFMRFNYLALTTGSCFVALMFFLYPFQNDIVTPTLVLANMPLLALFARDLKVSGYRYSDALRACAMNLMLVPIIAGGVFKQFQQMFTGRKIPFGRTPKVPGRTAAPAFYCVLQFVLTVWFFSMSVYYLAGQNWAKFGFVAVNTLFFSYALFHFVGIRPLFEDIFAGGRQLSRQVAGVSAKTAPLLRAGWRMVPFARRARDLARLK